MPLEMSDGICILSESCADQLIPGASLHNFRCFLGGVTTHLFTTSYCMVIFESTTVSPALYFAPMNLNVDV